MLLQTIFFTSVTLLAKFLLSHKTTIVGTLKKTSQSLCEKMRVQQKRYETSFYTTDDKKIIALSYQCKPKKNVVLCSTMHYNPIVLDGEKKKPEVVCYYNINKVGVDCLDAMLRLYSTKSATRR